MILFVLLAGYLPFEDSDLTTLNKMVRNFVTYFQDSPLSVILVSMLHFCRFFRSHLLNSLVLPGCLLVLRT